MRKYLEFNDSQILNLSISHVVLTLFDLFVAYLVRMGRSVHLPRIGSFLIASPVQARLKKLFNIF